MSCRDLDIIVTNELSPSEHVNNITVKAHQRANAILRCFASRDNKLLVRAFTTYVRPLLEYNSVVWSPYLKQDIERLENVQRRFTKRLVGLKHVEYAERLQRLNLHSLELRRLRSDLIWCYKIVFGLVRLNFGDFLKFCPVSTTRGHPYKLYTSHCTSIRSRFFAHRVIKAWNSLPQSTNFSSLAAFKRSILQTDHSKHLTMFFV